MFYPTKRARRLEKPTKASRFLKKIDILVYRTVSSGLGESKPCADCIQTMKDMHIRGVYYSTCDGVLIYEKITCISNTHHSILSKNILLGKF